MPYILTDSAEKDLEGILEYTLVNWGLTQMESYAQLLEETLQAVAIKPHAYSSLSRSEFFEGCRSVLVGSHIIFYTAKASNVIVIRVLHQSMDAHTHLK